jgi:hypothetical protein
MRSMKKKLTNDEKQRGELSPMTGRRRLCDPRWMTEEGSMMANPGKKQPHDHGD